MCTMYIILRFIHYCNHGVRHGFKMGGGPKAIIELESEPKFNINLYKII